MLISTVTESSGSISVPFSSRIEMSNATISKLFSSSSLPFSFLSDITVLRASSYSLVSLANSLTLNLAFSGIFESFPYDTVTSYVFPSTLVYSVFNLLIVFIVSAAGSSTFVETINLLFSTSSSVSVSVSTSTASVSIFSSVFSASTSTASVLVFSSSTDTFSCSSMFCASSEAASIVAAKTGAQSLNNIEKTTKNTRSTFKSFLSFFFII